MLFLVSLLFAGIAQIWFGGIMTEDKANLLSNPDYIYLNFNINQVVISKNQKNMKLTNTNYKYI